MMQDPTLTKVTSYVYPTEQDFLEKDVDQYGRYQLHWTKPPLVNNDLLDPVIEFLTFRNEANPAACYSTKRRIAEELIGANLPVPRFEQGESKELLYNSYIKNVVIPLAWGVPKQIETKYLSTPSGRYGTKQPDLIYEDRLTGRLTLSEVKMFYNANNSAHAEHLTSAIDQLLLTKLLLTDNNYSEYDQIDLELIVVVNPGVLYLLRETINRLDRINHDRLINIRMRFLNIWIPFEEIELIEVLNAY